MRRLKLLALVAACAAVASPMTQAQGAGHDGQASVDRLCADQGEANHHAEFVTWLEQRLALTDVQLAKFREFQDVRAKSLADTKTKLCANKPDLATFESRLVFSQSILEERLAALRAENPTLLAFYNSLDDKQKRIFDDIREHFHH